MYYFARNLGPVPPFGSPIGTPGPKGLPTRGPQTFMKPPQGPPPRGPPPMGYLNAMHGNGSRSTMMDMRMSIVNNGAGPPRGRPHGQSFPPGRSTIPGALRPNRMNGTQGILGSPVVPPVLPPNLQRNSVFKTPQNMQQRHSMPDNLYSPSPEGDQFIQSRSSGMKGSMDRPSHDFALTQRPPLSGGEKRPFGKLNIVFEKGVSLKAGQGVFGRADPYLKIKVGDQNKITETHMSGGKNPVRIFTHAFVLLY